MCAYNGSVHNTIMAEDAIQTEFHMYNWHIKSFFFLPRKLKHLPFGWMRKSQHSRTNEMPKCMCNFCWIYFANNIHLLCSSFGFNVVPCYRQPKIHRPYKTLPFCFGCCVHISGFTVFFFFHLFFSSHKWIPHSGSGVCLACLFGAFLVISFRLQFGWLLFSFRLYLLFISIGVDGLVVPRKEKKRHQ